MKITRSYRAFTRVRDLSNNAVDTSKMTYGYGDLPLFLKIALFIRFDMPLISDLIGLLIELPVFIIRVIKAISYDLYEMLLSPITLYVYLTGEYKIKNQRRAK